MRASHSQTLKKRSNIVKNAQKWRKIHNLLLTLDVKKAIYSIGVENADSIRVIGGKIP